MDVDDIEHRPLPESGGFHLGQSQQCPPDALPACSRVDEHPRHHRDPLRAEAGRGQGHLHDFRHAAAVQRNMADHFRAVHSDPRPERCGVHDERLQIPREVLRVPVEIVRPVGDRLEGACIAIAARADEHGRHSAGKKPWSSIEFGPTQDELGDVETSPSRAPNGRLDRDRLS